MSSSILVQNTLGNSLINLLHGNLVSAIGLGAIAFCGSNLELLDGGLQLGLCGLIACVSHFTDQNALLGRLNIRQTKHLLMAFLHDADFSTVQYDILAGNIEKSKLFLKKFVISILQFQLYLPLHHVCHLIFCEKKDITAAHLEAADIILGNLADAAQLENALAAEMPWAPLLWRSGTLYYAKALEGFTPSASAVFYGMEALRLA